MKKDAASQGPDEGVIKFDVRLETAAADWPAAVRDLEAWRHILWQQGLVGVEKQPLEVGYGNVSMRLGGAPAQPSFLITATQTGHKSRLTADDYVCVTACSLHGNAVQARGRARPSSESLAHHIIYRLRPDAGFVFHVHSALIWSQADRLGLPCTPADVAYGTPAMANAIAALFRDTDLPATRVLAMRGHKDGIIAFGATADAAGTTLMAVLARALAAQSTL
ncbi:MAG: class II aldolase/adducin family protein [Gammaproteobacteria bacterium]|nr:class II aldolase/adducin family protein [Gammaproteobacteria bacterium]